MKRLILLLACAAVTPVWGFTPQFPGPATQTGSFQEALTSYRLPIGPYGPQGLPHEPVEGAFQQTSWRIASPGLSTLSLLAPMRDQLKAQGWQILFECQTEFCGGFDFRYGTEILPEPDMHVDLTDFRFLSARRSGPTGPEFISLLVSRSTESGFVQQILVTPAAASPPATIPLPEETALPDPAEPTAPLASVKLIDGAIDMALEKDGFIVLEDLVFASGSSELAPGNYSSLAALADYMTRHPERRLVLVGHTDASGALVSNIALSRKRAESVRKALVALGDFSDRISAEGVGYLAPRQSNDSPDGRNKNRRVEVMLLPSD